MLCACYHTDPATLIAALSEVGLLTRYLDAVALEAPSLADRAMIVHIKRMSTMASRVLGEGLDRVCLQDRATTDMLLSDLFAVATYHGWPLPISALGTRDLEVAGLPRGLLGADIARDGAHVFVLDSTTVALARVRESDDEVAMDGHARSQ